jgi:CubicO group peptidase (beta-lactamase class C family)
LGHLAGVRHYNNRAESNSTRNFPNLNTALGTFSEDPLRHEPGTRYLYTTFGYNLLGSVAEGAGKKGFRELLDDNVFQPAGMSQTIVDDQFAVIPHRARGYIRPSASVLESLPADQNLVKGRLYNSPLHDTSMKIPGGGLLSTASDLIRFATSVNTGKLLSKSTCQLMWTSQKTADGKETGYGLGWKISTHAGRKVVWHTGGQSGTSTVFILFPGTGTAVALMCNLQHASLLTAAHAIADAVQPPAQPMPKTSNDVAIKEKIFGNMSKRAAELLRDDLEAKGPVKVSDVEAAQKEILAIARRMAEAGEIALGGKGGDEMI